MIDAENGTNGHDDANVNEDRKDAPYLDGRRRSTSRRRTGLRGLFGCCRSFRTRFSMLPQEVAVGWAR